MDTIIIKGFVVSAIIGVFDWERKTPQDIIIDVEMQSHTALATLTNKIEHALNYKTVCDKIAELTIKGQYQLLETLAEHCATMIQQEFDVTWLSLAIYKPDAIEQANQVGIKIKRGKKYPRRDLWLSIGSNIDRQKNILNALKQLEQLFGQLIISPVYESPAIGFEGKDFLNLVVGIQSDLAIFQIEKSLKVIEEMNGRVKQTEKFAPRTLDIDILTWGDKIIQQDGLDLPKDEILKYAHVLKPLVDVAGLQRHPILNIRYAHLWRTFQTKNKTIELSSFDLAIPSFL